MADHDKKRYMASDTQQIDPHTLEPVEHGMIVGGTTQPTMVVGSPEHEAHMAQREALIAGMEPIHQADYANRNLAATKRKYGK